MSGALSANCRPCYYCAAEEIPQIGGISGPEKAFLAGRMIDLAIVCTEAADRKDAGSLLAKVSERVKVL